MRHDPNSAQVQAVGIPAGLNRNVGMGSLVRVTAASSMQQNEFVVGKVEKTTAKFHGELRATFSVVGVDPFIDSP